MSNATTLFQQLVAAEVIDINKLHPLIDELRQSHLPLSYAAFDPTSPESIRTLQDIVMQSFVANIEGTLFARSTKMIRKLEPLFLPKDLSDPTAQARLFAAFYLIESKLDTNGVSLEKLLSIELVDSDKECIVELDELRGWATKYISYPRGIKIINNAVKDAKATEVDLSKLVSHVQFFTCDDAELWGFSGVGTLYLNVNAFKAGVESARSMLTPEYYPRLEKLLKLAVASVGFHEITFMAIRKGLNTAVLSTVALKSKYVYFYTSEPGAVAQIRLFNSIPDWWHAAVDDATMEAMWKFGEQGKETNSKFPNLATVPTVKPTFCPGMYKCFKPQLPPL